MTRSYQERIEQLARDLQWEAERAPKPEWREDPEPSPGWQRANGPDSPQQASGLVMVRAADVTPVAVDWIWEGRIARGKLTIIAGAPDVGKSQIGAYIAARITKREHWPQAALAPQGDVVILASEDSIEDTWVPRLMAACADLARVFFRQDGDR
jgi:putative DNA primase/helicase